MRCQLEEAAQQANRPLSAELEARLAATADLDVKGLELIRALSREIALICRMTAKRWHIDLTSWAAVAEMLRIGPIHDFNPDRPQDDDILEARFDKLAELEHSRSALIAQLADMGIAARRDPDKSASAAGIEQLPDRTRSATRLMCEKLDDADERSRAVASLQELLRIDDEVRRAENAFREALRPYYEATAMGKQLYRLHLKREAERRRSLGESYDIFHLMEVDP
ncbi:hypothetical protein [Novosphingobium sp.]|uniref:hypothetical protein n=1 Tax=Novosphingobium sp. TaxID=1874826 RepID=UPI00260AAC47|nr:hypothetical protein [Novosphingobium sp.]